MNIKDIFKNRDDFEFLTDLFQFIEKEKSVDKNHRQNQSRQILRAIFLLQMYTENGGFDMAFYELPGRLSETIKFLKEIGGNDAAEIAEKAAGLLGEKGLDLDRKTRQNMMGSWPDENFDKLSMFDSEFYDCNEELTKKLADYCRKHEKYFLNQ